MAAHADAMSKLEVCRAGLVHLSESLNEMLAIHEGQDWPGLLAKFNALIARHHSLIREVSSFIPQAIDRKRKISSVAESSEFDTVSDGSLLKNPAGNTLRKLTTCPYAVFESDPFVVPSILLRSRLIPEVEELEQKRLQAAAQALEIDESWGLDAAALHTFKKIGIRDCFVSSCQEYFKKARKQVGSTYETSYSDMVLLGLPGVEEHTPHLSSLIIQLLDAINLTTEALQQYLYWMSDGPEYRPNLFVQRQKSLRDPKA